MHLNQNIAIDLGTSSVLVHAQGKGIVMREPSLVAIDVKKNKLIGIGEAARELLGRSPANVTVVRPVIDGVIANYHVTVQMMEYILHKVCGTKRMFKPHVLVAVPSDVTDVQRRSAERAALAAGAGRANTIEEAMAAALGARLPVSDPGGNLVVDIGAGTTNVAVLSLDGVVISRGLQMGGMKLDENIVRHIKNRHNVAIGDRMAEEIKIAIGSAYPLEQEMTYETRGRDLVTGLPRAITVTSKEIRDIMYDPLMQIIVRIKNVLEKTPPELSSDIIDRGITLTGGTALLRGIDRLIGEATQLDVHIADDPMSCVAIGAGRALAEHKGMAEHAAMVR